MKVRTADMLPDDPASGLKNLEQTAQEHFMISLNHLNQILSNQQVFEGVPSFVNNRHVASNLELVKACLCLSARGFLTLKELRECVLAFEVTASSLHRDSLPLKESLLQECLRSVNLTLDSNVFQMWCRKCWPFLSYTKSEMNKSKSNAIGTIYDGVALRFGAGAEAIKTGKEIQNFFSQDVTLSSDPMDVFKSFYIQPHEFLSLLVNCKNRSSTLTRKPICQRGQLDKQAYYDFNGDNKFNLYKLTSEDLQRDLRPNMLLKNNLKDEFWQNPPLVDEGRALPNSEAGITVRKDKKLIEFQPYTEGLQLKSSTLREALLHSRDFKKQMHQKKLDYYDELKRRQERARQVLIEKGKLDRDRARAVTSHDAVEATFITEHKGQHAINAELRTRDPLRSNVHTAQTKPGARTTQLAKSRASHGVARTQSGYAER